MWFIQCCTQYGILTTKYIRMEKEIIEYLWQIIDDIDTASDIAKSNDVAYRNMVEKLQKKRWNIGITTDGYELDLTKMKVPKQYCVQSAKYKVSCSVSTRNKIILSLLLI